jgi:dihydrofolate reductase
MRTLSLIEFVTLDGVMQGFGSPDEDRDGGFEYGGWGVPYADRQQADDAAGATPRTSAYLFGRRTYEKMAAFWPHQAADDPIAASLNDTPKYVATRTLSQADLTWNGARILDGDPVPAVRKLKAEGDGGIAVLGSGVLAQELIRGNLVDSYHLYVHPLVMGTGKRLFRAYDRPLRLRLANCSQTGTGVIVLSYEVE